ncbi:MAG: flagellar hook-associated protein FlgK [Deltaproteobacteria bacterium]|nr:flagellar hook-associated protein FlgK [Deltaproteobacteria bacterium]
MGLNIFGTLNTAAQGMTAQQVGLNVTGQNVANVNTDGYSRRMVELSPMPGPPTGGGGVEVEGIKRYTDQFATARLVQENGNFGSADERSQILAHVAELFNDIQDGGLGSAFDNFFGSIRLLESSPNDATVRQEVLARAQELSSTFNRVSNEVESVRVNIDNVLRSSAANINLSTSEIAKLNDTISMGLVKGQDVSDLQDRRDNLIQSVSEEVSIKYFEDETGKVSVFLQGGPPLVEGIYQSELFVNDMAVPGGAAVQYRSSNGQVTDVTSNIEGGRLGGALDVRDNTIPGFADDLDQLAYDFITAVNAQHSAGFGLDGVGGRNMFEPVGAVAGAASAMTLSTDVAGVPDNIAAADDPAMLPGDNRNALAMADLVEQPLTGGGTITFGQGYSNLVGNVGVEARRSNDEASLRAASRDNIKTIRDSSTGVSLDEEMTNLIKYQRAYQASARVLSVIDEAIQALLSLK